MPDSPPPEISGYVNFRDLGGHETPGGRVRLGRVYRSDSLAHVNPADVEHLVEERGVRTVVDLRGATEVDAYPNHPMRDAGATIHHVPLIDPAKREQSGFEWETMSLVDLYRFILTSAGPQFAEVLQIIAEPANHPVVFHCAAGKDRAGLVAATVLGLLEVADDEIVADYAQTSAALEELRARAQKRAEGTGRAPADRFMTADAQTMREVLAWLRVESGGFEPYLLSHGFTDGELALLGASLIEPSEPGEPGG
jgi:protein-tyrosine phosphatase